MGDERIGVPHQRRLESGEALLVVAATQSLEPQVLEPGVLADDLARVFPCFSGNRMYLAS